MSCFLFRLVVATCAAGLAACGAATAPLVGVEQAEVPTCREAAVSPTDANGGCVAAAALVKCSQNEVCISNDPTSCNGSTGCHDECSTSDEYALACDDRTLPGPQPPAACQQKERAANGALYYCCPCNP
jgi:hypothetical protein